jgi:hypothetical protein
MAGEAVDEGESHARGQGLGHENQVDPHPAMLVKVARPVIPPRVEPILVVLETKRIDQPEGLHLLQRLAFRRTHVGGPHEGGRVPHVPILRGHVEVPAHQRR